MLPSTVAVANISVAGTGSLTLAGGTILNSVVSTAKGASLVISNGTLDGVTVNGVLDVGDTYSGANLTVTNGLVLNGTMPVGNPTNASFGLANFSGTQTLGGSGTVVFGNETYGFGFITANALRLPTGGTTLTIGGGITVRGQNGFVGYSDYYVGPQNVSVVNQGTISCDVSGGTIVVSAQPLSNQGLLAASNGGLLNVQDLATNVGQISLVGGGVMSVGGNWTNAGTINATNSTLNFGGDFTLADLGVFNRSGGTVNLTGTINNSNTMLTLNATTGSLVLNGGTVQGGAITSTSGASFIIRSGTLDGVTVNGNWDVGASVDGAILTVTNGLTLNRTMLVGNPTNGNFRVG